MLQAFELIGYQSPRQETSASRSQVRSIRTEMMQQLVAMFPDRISQPSGNGRFRSWLKV